MIARPPEVAALDALHAARTSDGRAYAYTQATEGKRAGERHHTCPGCGSDFTVSPNGSSSVALRCKGDPPCDPEYIRGMLAAVPTGPVGSNRPAERAPAPPAAPLDRLTSGAAFILDAPEDVPTVWGNGSQVIWPSGEPLWIVAPPGLGKTTLGQQLALKRHGIGDSTLLGAPVEVDPRAVLYIAADRPMQAARSFRRMVTAADRQGLEHFHVWPGPLPFDLASTPEALGQWAKGMGAGTIFIDSLKDVALDLASDEGGSRVNLAIQHCIAEGLEVVVLHHQRKAGSDNRTPRSLDDVYGSTWLTAGAGSVLLLWGKPGDPIVDLRHLKQPHEEFGPVSVHHDHERGESRLHEPNDLVAVAANTPGGLTVEDAAKAIFGTADPDRNQREKARRRLESLVAEGKLEKASGGPRTPTSYTPKGQRVAA